MKYWEGELEKRVTMDLIKSIGWKFKEQYNQSDRYQTGFNGNSWYELEDDRDYITISRKYVSDKPEKILFQGEIEYYQDLKKICEILKIKDI